MDSVKRPFPECIRLLCENIKLDPYFNDFYQWSRQVGVPVIVLSSGMTPIIRGLLVHLIGPEANDIEIVSNEVVDRPPKKKEEEGGWQIQFHDDSGFGHDKSLTIRPYAKHFESHPDEPKPVMLYAGDGKPNCSGRSSNMGACLVLAVAHRPFQVSPISRPQKKQTSSSQRRAMTLWSIVKSRASLTQLSKTGSLSWLPPKPSLKERRR